MRQRNGNECGEGGGAGYACKLKNAEKSWEKVYEEVELAKENEDKEYNDRISKSGEFTFEEVEYDPASIGDTNDSKTEIPNGYEITGIRFRSKDLMNKQDCKALIKDMITDLEKDKKHNKRSN